MTAALVHDCEFAEYVIGEGDFEPDDALRPGMKVLTPCACGELPSDEIETLARFVDEFTEAFVESLPAMPLFHWSPRARRKQILRYGLRPSSRATTSSASFPVVCFADSPSWAWALSGEMSYTPAGDWDLWQTDLGRLPDPVILPGPDRLSGIYEVRTRSRVYKRDLWLVGTRHKP